MASLFTKVEEALVRLDAAQQGGVVRHSALSRTYRDRLVKAGYLSPIVKGWYFVSGKADPDRGDGWPICYWEFVRQYLEFRFGQDYCLTAESSLLLHVSTTIPTRLGAMCRRGDNKTLRLPGSLSLFLYHDPKNFPDEVVTLRGLRAMSMEAALVRVPSVFFRRHPNEARAILERVEDVGAVLRLLLEDGKSVVAARLAGAFRGVGRLEDAAQIVYTMRSADHRVPPVLVEPDFEAVQEPEKGPAVADRSPAIEEAVAVSPIAEPIEDTFNRMWMELRGPVLFSFPNGPGLPSEPAGYLHTLEEAYSSDALASLYQEGYSVLPRLVEWVRAEDLRLNIDGGELTREAVIVRGYLECSRSVRVSIDRLLHKEPTSILRNEFRKWRMALYMPAIEAGNPLAFEATDYRKVSYGGSDSTVPEIPAERVAEAMGILFDLIDQEPSPQVSAILGHLFVSMVRPYQEDTGIMARFLMNAMFAVGGYPWTVIREASKPKYESALANGHTPIGAAQFAKFILGEMLARV